jgi:hypothetical protein
METNKNKNGGGEGIQNRSSSREAVKNRTENETAARKQGRSRVKKMLGTNKGSSEEKNRSSNSQEKKVQFV